MSILETNDGKNLMTEFFENKSTHYLMLVYYQSCCHDNGAKLNKTYQNIIFLVQLASCQFWLPNSQWFENNDEERIGKRKLCSATLIYLERKMHSRVPITKKTTSTPSSMGESVVM